MSVIDRIEELAVEHNVSVSRCKHGHTRIPIREEDLEAGRGKPWAVSISTGQFAHEFVLGFGDSPIEALTEAEGKASIKQAEHPAEVLSERVERLEAELVEAEEAVDIEALTEAEGKASIKQAEHPAEVLSERVERLEAELVEAEEAVERKRQEDGP